MRRMTLVAAGAGSALVVATAGTAGVQALITGAQIKDGTIQSRDIANGTIRRGDLAASAVASLRGDRGPSGAQGPSGATGPQGLQGPQGAAGPQGSAGTTGAQGAKGDKGDTGDVGSGVDVTGSVAAVADLPAGAAVGDAYIVTATGHLHVWDGAAYVDTGSIVGPQGLTGAAGADGADGLAGYEIVTGTPVAIAEDDWIVSGTATCPAGKVAIGGGAQLADDQTGVDVAGTFPTAAGGSSAWTVTVANDGAYPNSLTPYAICADVG